MLKMLLLKRQANTFRNAGTKSILKNKRFWEKKD
jgi:hypothetical protein